MVRLILVLVILFANKSLFCQEHKIVKVYLNYVNPQISTMYDIHCDDFEKAFQSSLNTVEIEDGVILKEIGECLKSVKYFKGQGNIDVRRKLFVYFEDKPEPTIICADKFNTVLINGRFTRKNKELAGMIRKLTLIK